MAHEIVWMQDLMIINKVLLEHSHAGSLTKGGCFCSTRAELSSCDRDCKNNTA